MDTLPKDAWMEVLQRLDLRSCATFGQVSSTARHLCKSSQRWDAVRLKLKLPPPRRRAWKHRDAHSIVLASACVKCRVGRRLLHQPLCLHCMKQHPALNSLRLAIVKTAAQKKACEAHLTFWTNYFRPYVYLGLGTRSKLETLTDTLNSQNVQYATALNSCLSNGGP